MQMSVLPELSNRRFKGRVNVRRVQANMAEVNTAASLLPACSHLTTDGIKSSGKGPLPGSTAGH